MRRSAARVADRLRRLAGSAGVGPAACQAGEEAHLGRAGGRAVRLFSSAEGTPAQLRGPVSYMSLGLTIGTGAGLLWWYNSEKDRKLQQISGGQGAVAGQAAIGGPFDLLDVQGRRFTDRDLLGEFALLYFGFTYCPDICPEELEKVAAAVDLVEKQAGARIVPVFISIDSERDSVQQVKQYVAEFHPRLVGLTGPVDKVKEAARAYRVYYTKTADSGDDYLVDHSIITYLVNPEGQFVSFYGKNYDAEEMARSVAGHVQAWRQRHPEYGSSSGSTAGGK